MLLLAHTITGAVIGEKIGNPWLGMILALGSHFILDWIPHWSYDVPAKFDPREFIKILPDVIPSCLIYILFIFSYPEHWLTITIAVTAAIIPDFLTLTHYIPGLNKIFSTFVAWHGRLQVHDDKIIGLTSQVVYIGMLIVILLVIK
jgi:hypothetical protein